MTSKEIILEIKKQIWDNAYHVKEHHWTQIYSNLDLLALKFDEYDTKIIMLNWLKSVLEVYNTGGTYNQYAIRIKENFADTQGALKVIKEWLDEREP